MDALRNTVRTYPILDNHAHNLLLPSQSKTYPFLSITTEAQGEALKDTPRSLPHIRAARQLRQLYGCDSSSTWEVIASQHVRALESDPDALIRKCFDGIHSILIDDGLDKETVQSTAWHSQFVPGVVRRIVRIEAIAEDIMRTEIAPSYKRASSAIGGSGSSVSFDEVERLWTDFYHAFEQALDEAIADPNVAGFKSVVCYRTGLAILPAKEGTASEPPPEDVVLEYLENALGHESWRFENKVLNDWLVNFALFKLSLAYHEDKVKPIQFHTGLGDKDIDLLLSDPAHLQKLIEYYDEVPFVILHSSYPYTRQAGYLATVYANAFLDIGEVFPMVSRDGQEQIIRQALEIVPGNKILYSSDGHWFPETYWLANKQFRTGLEKVLVEYVEEGDLILLEAVQLAKDILFHNSNRIYALDLTLEVDAATTPLLPTIETAPAQEQEQATDPTPSTTISTKLPNTSYDLPLFNTFAGKLPDLAYIYIQWLDYMGQLRTRMLPARSFRRLLEANSSIGISQGNTGTLQNDSETSVMTPIGQIYVRPVLESLRPTHEGDMLRRSKSINGQRRAAAMVMGTFCNSDGNALPSCPRGRVAHVLDLLQQEYNLAIMLGFEIEIVFLERSSSSTWTPITNNHSWSTLSDEQYQHLDLLTSCVDALADCGIEVQQFHAESAPGQYEFVLEPLPALQAIDSLIQARNVIQQVAASRDLRATLHPQPFPGIGTAAHVHFSGSRSIGEKQEKQHRSVQDQMKTFVAGILTHLSALCAYTMPSEVSYSRVAASAWMGGLYVAWGTQNRECPLRRVSDVRWELRVLDGLANPYFAVAGLLASGLLGLREGVELGKWKDCQVDLAKVGEQERQVLGVVEKLPNKLEIALNRLRVDESLKSVLGQKIVDDYIVMKEKESEMLNGMEEEQKRTWIIERY